MERLFANYSCTYCRKTTADYLPALFSLQGLRGDYFVDGVSEKAYTRWLSMDN